MESVVATWRQRYGGTTPQHNSSTGNLTHTTSQDLTTSHPDMRPAKSFVGSSFTRYDSTAAIGICVFSV